MLTADYYLAKEARAKRKERIAKNEHPHVQKLATTPDAGAGTGRAEEGYLSDAGEDADEHGQRG